MTRRMEKCSGFTELVPILGFIKSEDRFKWITGLQGRPPERNDIMFRQVNSGTIFEWNKFFIFGVALILKRTKYFRDHRSMSRRANSNVNRGAASYLNGFLVGFKINPLAIRFILIGIIRIYFFDK